MLPEATRQLDPTETASLVKIYADTWTPVGCGAALRARQGRAGTWDQGLRMELLHGAVSLS